MNRLRSFQAIRGVYRKFLYVITALVLAVSTSLPAFASPSFTNHSISSTYYNASHVVSAGGSLWYLEAGPGGINDYTYIGNMTTSGTVTNYNMRTLTSNSSFRLRSLTTGPDGNIWFNGFDGYSASTGVLNVSTGAVTVLSAAGIAVSSGDIGSITLGSDGNLWYTAKASGSPSYNYLFKVNASTGTTTNSYTFSDTNSNLTSMTTGPGGSLWITDSYQYNNKVYGISVGGSTGSGTYTIPGASTTNHPFSITSGSDGNLWLLDNNNEVLKMTTAGVFTQYALPTGVYANYLTAGPDGAMWFLETGTGKIGRMSTSGTVTEYTIPGTGVTGADLQGLTTGPDGAMWFNYKDSGGYKLGRLGY